MTGSLRPITWVSPLERLRFGASAFSGEDTARSWISLCCPVVGIAADHMLGRRAEASREARVRAFGIDRRTGAVQLLSTPTTKSRSSAASATSAGQHSSRRHEAKVEGGSDERA